MLTPSNQYLQAVEEINDYVNQAKCRASVSVNSEIMKTNIFIGNVIIRNSEWGNKFVENLSKDMKMRFPSAKGYSVRNLKYMKKFAQTFTEDDVDEYGLGRITWSHHQILMSKVSNREEYIWYLEKTLEHKWSVDDLTSQVKSQLYERQAVANKISNFERRLPAEQKNMVLSTMKDPYMFDFIDYTEEMLETDIENELVKNVTSLLMELGTGFAFMGQQYHLEVGEKDFYIDLLFYNTKLRCYVAIDLKTGEFKPEQAGNCWNSCWLTMLQICILSILAFWKRSCIWERNILISCEFNLDSFLWMGNGSWKYCLRVYVVYHDCRNPVWKTIL